MSIRQWWMVPHACPVFSTGNDDGDQKECDEQRAFLFSECKRLEAENALLRGAIEGHKAGAVWDSLTWNEAVEACAAFVQFGFSGAGVGLLADELRKLKRGAP